MIADPGERLKILEQEETSIRLCGDFTTSRLGMALRTALFDALALKTKLPRWLKVMPGMSGRKYRYFVNNLVGLIPDARYLEIGSWTGSTACAAIFGNRVTATCIDDWSGFGGPKDTFAANIARVLSEETRFTFIEKDFRAADFHHIGRFNIYMFDGPHDEQDQFDGIVRVLPALDAEFVLIVDDYNYARVESGTIRALEHLRLDVLAAVEIKTSQHGVHPKIAFQYSDWHDGYFLAVCRQHANA